MTCNASPQCNPDDPPSHTTPPSLACPFYPGGGKEAHGTAECVLELGLPENEAVMTLDTIYNDSLHKLLQQALGAMIKAWLAHLAAWPTSRDHVLPPLSAALVQHGRATDQQHRHHDRWQGVTAPRPVANIHDVASRLQLSAEPRNLGAT